jgi:uncharacterized protein (UPF0276 family)
MPLFESGKVDAIEWSFDTLFNRRDIPDWFVELLRFYSNENRLIGHGVFFSLFSGRWLPDQQKWLEHLEKISRNFHFDHITEHFGFMTGEDFHKGAPMNIPFTNSTLEIGRDRLKRIHEACHSPVGIENLAFAYSSDEVKRHGEFLAALVEPVNGFIILDLHNVYCQMMNFGMEGDDLLQVYPLDLVREIHISGGSWEPSGIAPVKSVRRDTHDDAVPVTVFDLLTNAIPRCKNLKYVVLEQIGTGLISEKSKENFRNDFFTMDEIVSHMSDERSEAANPFLPISDLITGDPVEDLSLYEQQIELTNILEQANGFRAALEKLNHSSLANSDWKIEAWDPYMLETALRIAQKWKEGFR